MTIIIRQIQQHREGRISFQALYRLFIPAGEVLEFKCRFMESTLKKFVYLFLCLALTRNGVNRYRAHTGLGKRFIFHKNLMEETESALLQELLLRIETWKTQKAAAFPTDCLQNKQVAKAAGGDFSHQSNKSVLEGMGKVMGFWCMNICMKDSLVQ